MLCLRFQRSSPSPTVAIMQWKHEIMTHTDGLQVLVWHGSSRETDIATLAKYDVVRTCVTGSVDGTLCIPTGVDDLLGP